MQMPATVGLALVS